MTTEVSTPALSRQPDTHGYREEALEVVRECVALYRDLARDRPNAFNPVLARSLNNFYNHLSDLGHQEEALEVVQECVALRCDLARDRPQS